MVPLGYRRPVSHDCIKEKAGRDMWCLLAKLGYLNAPRDACMSALSLRVTASGVALRRVLHVTGMPRRPQNTKAPTPDQPESTSVPYGWSPAVEWLLEPLTRTSARNTYNVGNSPRVPIGTTGGEAAAAPATRLAVAVAFNVNVT
jgi:hypothetical protein